MAECAFCNSETSLYENGTPICIKCAEARETKRKPAAGEQDIRKILLQEVLDTTAVVNAASEEFNLVMSSLPNSIPHPDNTQRIHQVSKQLNAARKEMMRAHSRLNDFLSRGVIPEDLKKVADGNR